MNTSRSSKQQRLMILGNVLKAAAFSIAGTLIFAKALAAGYRAGRQASQLRTADVDPPGIRRAVF